MIVQELFKSLDKKEFIEYYIKYDPHTHRNDNDGRIYQYFTDLCNLKDLVPNKDKNIIWAIKELGTNNINSFLIREKDLYRKSGLPKEIYAYEFCDAREILNFDVSKACAYYLGDIEYAASIFYELTFFGYSLDDAEENISEKKEELNQAIEEIKSGNCGEPITLEEFCKKIDWKDERSDFEKQFDSDTHKIDNIIFKKQMKLLLDLEKHYHEN